jgi:hypothetical protein
LGLVWVWVFCKSFANFELDNLKYEKKHLIFGYGFEYKFKKLERKSKLINQISKKIIENDKKN